MAVYLLEDYMGRDNAVIGFPHLVVCMGLALRTANDLWGVHLTQTDASQATFNQFWTYATNKGLAAAAVTDMYSSCNLSVRYAAGTAAARIEIWKCEIRNFAARMNWHGNAHRFDTGVLAPTDGTYVEYQHQAHGAPACRIFYKKNEKTQQTGSVAVPNNGGMADCVAWDPFNNAYRAQAYNKTGMIVTTPGGIRELDYANRLVTYAVP
jgi:hypothetical protein